MHVKTRLLFCIGLLVLSRAALSAAPAAAPELKQLDVYVGTWQFEWTVHPSGLIPAGKVAGTERYEWVSTDGKTWVKEIDGKYTKLPTAPASPRQSETGFAPVPGGRLYYENAGIGDPIVFVHGNVGDCRHWDDQFDVFARELRVIRYDVRGFGRSSRPREGEPYADYEDLAALLDHLGIKSAHVAGWSMGSGIVVDFAVAHPDRTKSLISIGPWVNGQVSPATPTLIEQMVKVGDVFVRDGHGAALDLFMRTVLGPTVRDPAAGKKLRHIAADYSFCRQAANFPRPLTPPAAKRLAEIRVPTLIMTAEHEVPACLDAAAMLEESVPDSRKIVMPGTGHLLHMEKPLEFNRHVLGFLSEQAKRN
jgi:3-oxoadipate enol-lactonase